MQDFSNHDDRRQLFEGFRSEAKNRASAGRHERAVELYTKALELVPEDLECRIQRSNCHFHNGQYNASIEDANYVLKMNPKQHKAEFIKAESLYNQGEFERALICYHRANRLRPGGAPYIRGIKKSEAAIETSIGEGFKRISKGSSAVTQKSVPTQREPTSTSRHRAQANVHYSKKHSPKTVKNLLEELYGDWKFLEKLLQNENEILEGIEKEIKLEDNRKKKEKKNLSIPGSQNNGHEEEDIIVTDSYLRERRQAKQNRSEEIKGMVKKELTYLEDRTSFWIQQQASTRVPESKATTNVIPEIMKTIHKVKKSHEEGEYLDTLNSAEKALNILKKKGTHEVPDRLILMGTLHSFLGTAYCETGDLSNASKHHQHDFQIAEQQRDVEAKSRALDNLARVLIRSQKYSSAVRCLRKKIPLVQHELEAAWLYHEMGRCHLELEDYGKALACSQKSLEAAKHTEDIGWQLNAQVLWAQIKVEVQEFDAAEKGFEEALLIADDEGDEEASFALRRALINVRQKIKEIKEEEEQKKKIREEAAEEEDGQEAGNASIAILKMAFSQSDPSSEDEAYQDEYANYSQEDAKDDKGNDKISFHDESDQTQSDHSLNEDLPEEEGEAIFDMKISESHIVQDDSGSTTLSESESIADLQERPESYRGFESRPESTRPESTRTVRRPQSSMSRSSRPRSTAPQTHLPQY